MCQAVGLGIELRVTQFALATDQRQRFGLAGYLRFNLAMDALLLRVCPFIAIEVDHQPLPFAGRQQWQRGDILQGIGHDALQQVQPMSGHALDGRRLEQVGGIG